MGKFEFKKKLELNQFKEGAFLEFRLLSYKDLESVSSLNIDKETNDPAKLEKATKATLGIMKANLVSGSLPNAAGELVGVEAADLDELPIEILVEAIRFLVPPQPGA